MRNSIDVLCGQLKILTIYLNRRWFRNNGLSYRVFRKDRCFIYMDIVGGKHFNKIVYAKRDRIISLSVRRSFSFVEKKKMKKTIRSVLKRADSYGFCLLIYFIVILITTVWYFFENSSCFSHTTHPELLRSFKICCYL